MVYSPLVLFCEPCELCLIIQCFYRVQAITILTIITTIIVHQTVCAAIRHLQIFNTNSL